VSNTPNKAVTVAVAGLMSSAAVAALTILIESTTGFQLFTISLWVVIPIGAMATGFAAAIGYYLAAVRVHYRPTGLLFLQMVATAAATLALIYYINYSTMTLSDGRRVSAAISFGNYLDAVLTKSHYELWSKVAHKRQDIGEVGSFGYWLAGIQCIGFALGGMAVFGMLHQKATCVRCRGYVKTLKTKDCLCYSKAGLLDLHARLRRVKPGTDEFFALLQSEPDRSTPSCGTVPTWRLGIEFCSCPVCHTDQVRYVVSQLKKDEWSSIPELTNAHELPEGALLRATLDEQQD
jgi:hypothetical protein